MHDLRDLLVHELKDLYSAEKQLTKALPKLAKAATHPELKSAILHHLDETETHVNRLEQAFEMLGHSTRGAKCEAMQGLIKEGASDGLHDDPIISLNMFMTDPRSIRYEERVKAGKATINGVSLADRKKNLELGREIVEFRATVTADAIRKAIEANKK